MSIINKLANALEDSIVDRLRSNRDRSPLDSIEGTLLDGLASNRFSNDNFEKILDLLDANLREFEDILRIDAFRNSRDLIESILDVIIARQCDESGILDRMNDSEYKWVLGVSDTDLYHFIYPQSNNRRSSRGRYREDDRGYSRDRGRYDDRYDDRYSSRRDNRRRTSFTDSEPDRGYDDRPVYSSRNSRGSYQSNDRTVNSRNVRKNDGFSQIIKAKEARREQEEAREPSKSRRGGYVDPRPVYREVEENVSYEPVDNPRGHYREEVEEVQPERVERTPVDDRRIVFDDIPPLDRQGYDHTSERPYEKFWEDDCLWIASVNSTWKLTGSGIDAYPQLYNIYKYVSYHVMDKYGNVTQRFKTVNDDNRYINQRLLKDPSNYSKSLGRKIPKISEVMGDTKETPVEEVIKTGLEIGEMLDIDASDLDEATSTIRTSDNLSTSAIESRNKLKTSGDKSSLSIFMLSDPIEAVSKEEAGLIKSLYDQNTLTGLAKRMCEIEPSISKYNFDKINKRLSDGVIAEMRNAFGIDIKAMNFSKHWSKALEVLIKQPEKYNSDWIDNFAIRMNSMISTFLGIMEVDDDSAGVFENVINDYNKDRVIPLVSFHGVLSLNCTLDQLSIGRQLELSSPIVIRSSEDYYGLSTLHTVMDSLRESTEPSPRLLISTLCGALVEVRKHEMSSTNIVLSLYDGR